MNASSEILIYTDPSGIERVQVRLVEGTLWLTQRQLAALFDTSIQNVSQHLQAIYADGELAPEATIKKYLIVQTEGTRQVSREVDHFSLPAILAVGYRVRSAVGTRFRQWATGVLTEYAVKGFAMDDRRLKAAGHDDYFDELLARIRDIRSSERVFWRKVLDIYATSIDYDPRADASRLFFQTIQNKMHWATHGQTAAEVIRARANAEARNMGLTSWASAGIRQADAEVAKNYLSMDEIEALNRIVTAYLEFAELQAMNRRPMTMRSWIAKLDDFLRLSEREVLTHAGRVSAEAAKEHADAEYQKWRASQGVLPEPVDVAFDEAIREARIIEKERPRIDKKDDE